MTGVKMSKRFEIIQRAHPAGTLSMVPTVAKTDALVFALLPFLHPLRLLIDLTKYLSWDIILSLQRRSPWSVGIDLGWS